MYFSLRPGYWNNVPALATILATLLAHMIQIHISSYPLNNMAHTRCCQILAFNAKTIIFIDAQSILLLYTRKFPMVLVPGMH